MIWIYKLRNYSNYTMFTLRWNVTFDIVALFKMTIDWSICNIKINWNVTFDVNGI